MKKVVIASACRTAIGKFGGTLANVPAAELGSIVIKEALERAHVAPEQVDHVYMGCVIQAGLGQNVARQASLKAGLPIETPAVTVNVVCGSGLNCVNMAAQMIEAGDADIVVAGGMENMDMAPFAMMKGRYGYRMGAPMGKSELVDTMVNDALWDATGFNKHMGMTAENVCTNETYQKKYGYNPITREELDQFSYNSQVKADKAIKDGAFKDEIVPMEVKQKKQTVVFDTDEGPRPNVTAESISKLRPAFKEGGVVTAGNSSGINDAAALRQSDIGISVDSAVDIAKESADIILLEKDLMVLEDGVLEGRKTFGNIIKYVKMTASANFGNMFSVMAASAFLPFLPMLPIHLLIQNLLYDISQTTIPFDRMDAEYLRKPRKWDASDLSRFMICIGPISSVFDIVTYLVLWYVFGCTSLEHQTLFQSGWFIEGLLSQTLIVHMIRTRKIPFIQSRASWQVTGLTVLVMAIGILIPFTPLGHSIGLESLPLSYFPWLVGILLTYCILTQLVKSWYIRRFVKWL